MNMKKRGKAKVRAAIDSEPSLPMKAVSTILYNACTDMPTSIGRDIVKNAFLGFPMNSLTLFLTITARFEKLFIKICNKKRKEEKNYFLFLMALYTTQTRIAAIA